MHDSAIIPPDLVTIELFEIIYNAEKCVKCEGNKWKCHEVFHMQSPGETV